MKLRLLTLLAALLLCASGYGQTIKSLGFNTTNGFIVYGGTNPLTFTNSLQFATNARAATRTNLGVAPAPIFKVLTNDFSITNQTNMTVVDGLTISTEAGKAYVVELLPIFSAAFLFTELQIVASNATVYGFWDGLGNLSYSTNAVTNANSFSAGSDPRAPLQKFYVTANTNAGSIALQFKSTTDTNTNTIGAGSYMMAQEVTPTP